MARPKPLPIKCSVQGCFLLSAKAGMCNKHYLRQYRYGDTNFTKIDKGNPIKSFWRRVNKDGPTHPICGQCWMWTGAILSPKNPYGFVKSKRQKISAHRLSWTIHHGTIPGNLQVLHKCDNPRCVNPKHLFLGDNISNHADKVLKGRQAKGDQHGLAKLTVKKVRECRKRYVPYCPINGRNVLALECGVSLSTMGKALSGKGWKHVI